MKNTQKEFPENNLQDIEIPVCSEDDFARAVPYQNILEAKKSTTIRLQTSTIYYFQLLAKDTGIPYQTLINMFLDDCARKKLKPDFSWK